MARWSALGWNWSGSIWRGRPSAANSGWPTLSGLNPNRLTKRFSGPISSTAPLPKSPRRAGSGKLAAWRWGLTGAEAEPGPDVFPAVRRAVGPDPAVGPVDEGEVRRAGHAVAVPGRGRHDDGQVGRRGAGDGRRALPVGALGDDQQAGPRR